MIIDRASVIFTAEALPEDSHPSDSFASGDDTEDADVVAGILADLENGNDWAWCVIKVTATLDGFPWAGVDYLGGSSYASKSAFTAEVGGYYQDMCDQAFAALDAVVTKVLHVAVTLSHVGGK